MVTFRNNNGRRNTFRRGDRSFKSNTDRNKFNNNFSNTENFQRKSPGRNNHNAPKLIEKYNNLAREALSSGDKILSENYFQHADHFTRILNEKEIQKRSINSKDNADVNGSTINKEKNNEVSPEKSASNVDEVNSEPN
jgi:hypothetical protein|tara:strand:+ start:958 stop:1371 length:414 start_codon:yes stop_codon:yes gene_type:complete